MLQHKTLPWFRINLSIKTSKNTFTSSVSCVEILLLLLLFIIIIVVTVFIYTNAITKYYHCQHHHYCFYCYCYYYYYYYYCCCCCCCYYCYYLYKSGMLWPFQQQFVQVTFKLFQYWSHLCHLLNIRVVENVIILAPIKYNKYFKKPSEKAL